MSEAKRPSWAWRALMGMGHGAVNAGKHWLTTDYWYGANQIFRDDGLEKFKGLVRATTMQDPRGKGFWNLFTGRVESPLFGGLVMGAGIGYGVLQGAIGMEEMKATGRITGPMPAPFLAYDAVPNLEMFGRSTPQSAEEMAAGGDLVFALRDAYGT